MGERRTVWLKMAIEVDVKAERKMSQMGVEDTIRNSLKRKYGKNNIWISMFHWEDD